MIARNKQEMLAQLSTSRGNITYGLAAVMVLSSEEGLSLLEKLPLPDIGILFDRTHVADVLRKTEQRQSAIQEFYKVLGRSVVNDSFETITTYCKSTQQMDVVRQVEWFHFARIIRNLLTHHVLFEIHSKGDRQLIKAGRVVWRGKTISESMEGIPLSMSFFGVRDAYQLQLDMTDFVMEDLA